MAVYGEPFDPVGPPAPYGSPARSAQLAALAPAGASIASLTPRERYAATVAAANEGSWWGDAVMGIGLSALTAGVTGGITTFFSPEAEMWDWVSNLFSPSEPSIGNIYAPQDFSFEGLDPSGIVIDEAGAIGGTGTGVVPADWMRVANIAGQVFSDTPGGGNVMPNAGMQNVSLMGAVGAAGLRSLASVFGGAGARAIARFNLNGITGTVPQLWKYVRLYGPGAVATALGISVGTLGTMLLSNPERKRHRRRGISSRDIRTTKRVVNFVSRMAHQIGCVSAPRHFRRQRHASRYQR